jgi:Ala-tRNA(Pro) deacylase
MSIANRVSWYLDRHGVNYDLVRHRHTSTSLASARQAHVPPEQVAKCVVLADGRGFVVAVLPATRRLELDLLRDLTGRPLQIASERDLRHVFIDCEPGAVPPVGDAYDLPTYVDQALLEGDDLYFEGGGHEELVHVARGEFKRLMTRSRNAKISRPEVAAA